MNDPTLDETMRCLCRELMGNRELRLVVEDDWLEGVPGYVPVPGEHNVIILCHTNCCRVWDPRTEVELRLDYADPAMLDRIREVCG